MPAVNRTRRLIALAAIAGLAALYAGVRFATPVVPPLRHPLTGRLIPGMATDTAWLDRAAREAEEQPDRALDLIGLEPGMAVADVGAGTGYWTPRIAARIEPGGQLFATEVQPAMLQILRRKVVDLGLSNVTVIQGAEGDARLPAGGVDLILLVDVYHELRQPQAMLQSLGRALRPGGRLVLLEFRMEDPTLPIMPAHRMSVADARAEVEPEGFVFDRLIPGLPRQHILVFRPRPGSPR